MKINDDYEITRVDGVYTLYKNGNPVNNIDMEKLENLYKKLLIAPAQNRDRNEIFSFFMTENENAKTEAMEDDEKVKIGLERMIDFFTEFNFTPSFHFVNTFALFPLKERCAYINRYFSLMGSPYAEDIAAKIKSEDYRYFDRLAKQTGNNKFGSLHLNLFLDVSGSFYYNQKYTNQILKALCEMEDRYSYFTFDVIACGVGQQLLPRHDRAIQCEGGTYLTRDIEQLFHKMQKPQTMNYNIMLYDGDCEPDQNVAGKANAFGVLDKPNCFIISDPENEIYIKRAVHSAKTIISTNYKKELKDNILKALQLALS